MINLSEILFEYPPISLKEMSGITLMNRTDTKFITSFQILEEVLLTVKRDYQVQDIDHCRIASYHTTYLDTIQRDMYLAHHNGHKVREKIRTRTYLASNLTFLEVKNKNNKGRTDKKRIRIQSLDTIKQDGGDEFLNCHAWFSHEELLPMLENSFHRITLVNKCMTERLTIDTDIHFRCLLTGHTASLDNIVVIELKRDGYTFSPIGSVFRDLHIQPSGFSKYCIGSILTSPSLKRNRMKAKLRKVEKITNYKYNL